MRVLSEGRPPGMTQGSKSQIPIIISRGTVSYISRLANLIIPLHKDRTYPVLTNGPRPTTLGLLQCHGNKTMKSTASQGEMGEHGQAGSSHRAVGKRV